MPKTQRATIASILERETIHPFPARMAPDIALDAISGGRKKLRVLDPMMGSGTVLAVARSRGHTAIGVDIDPLAVLLSKVWTADLDRSLVKLRASDVLHRAKLILPALSARDAYPQDASEETRAFLRYWFDPFTRRQLTSLAKSIGRIRDQSVREALWCGFSRLIITKSVGASLALDLSHSRPHKAYERAPIKPFEQFFSAVTRVTANCAEATSEKIVPASEIHQGDARKLPLRAKNVDLVITSPPYLNAIDYLRCSKFSLVWMGFSIEELRTLRARSIGTEASGAPQQKEAHLAQSVLKELRLRPAPHPRIEAMLRRYVIDIHKSMAETHRVLKPGGAAVLVVGENTIRGTYIRNSRIVTSVAEIVGLQLTGRRSRRLPPNRRYLPPPDTRQSNQGLDARMRREIILTFQRPTE